MTLEGVSKTAILTLRARVDEHHRDGGFLHDPTAVKWFEHAEWPHELDDWYNDRVASFASFRAHEIDRYTDEAISWHGVRCVVELGAGLSTRPERVGPERADAWIDVDFEPVVALRKRLGAVGRQIACSVLDDAWLDQITAAPEQLLIIAEGLIYYIPREDIDTLLSKLRRRFPGALMVFDVCGTMDFETTNKRSSEAGTPLLWRVDSFAGAFDELGLSIVEGWEPETKIALALELLWPRFGPKAAALIKELAEVPGLADTRSGVIGGRLSPLDG